MSANNKKDGNYIYPRRAAVKLVFYSDQTEVKHDGAVSVREEQNFLTGSLTSPLLQLHQWLFPFSFLSFFLLFLSSF